MTIAKIELRSLLYTAATAILILPVLTLQEAALATPATAGELLGADSDRDGWQEFNNSVHGFKIKFPLNWTFTNNPTSLRDSYVAAQFCPANPQSSAEPESPDELVIGLLLQCVVGSDNGADDRVWVTVYQRIASQFTFSGDNATALVDQFLSQKLDASSEQYQWSNFEVLNKTTFMLNATDDSSFEPRNVTIPAIIVDYRHNEGDNDFRRVEMYTMYGGKGFVVEYLPSSDADIETGEAFYPPIVEEMFTTFQPIIVE